MADATPVDTSRFKYWFEDFTVGLVLDLGRRKVTRDEIIDFARQFDPQPFHVDEAAAARSPYGGIIASGWHTCSLAMRLMVDGAVGASSSIGSPGVDNVRWIKPVRPDDELHLTMQVLESTPSRSKPDRGAIRARWEMTNQAGELVMSMEGMGMYLRRTPGTPA